MTVLKLNQIRTAVLAAPLVICLVLPVAGLSDPSYVKRDFRFALQCAEQTNCIPDRSNRLITEVVSMLQPSAIRSESSHEQAAGSQLSCQKAIVSGSVSYIWRRLDLVQRGLAPEMADQKAVKELDRIFQSCHVPVAQINQQIIPQIGSPCGTYLGPPGSWIDVNSLHSCLHTTLDFYTDYLGY